MPKTTKSTRKTSSTSTKKSGLKRRFDITNKKIQFFVVIGIVAILGGGYFTVRSFANTRATFGFADMRCDIKTGDAEYCNPVDEPQKNNNKVYLLTSQHDKNGVLVANRSISMTKDRKYTTCVTAKGVGAVRFIYQDQSKQYSTTGPTIFFDNTSGYTEKCSKTILSWTASSAKKDITVTLRAGSHGTFLTVSQIAVGEAAIPISTKK